MQSLTIGKTSLIPFRKIDPETKFLHAYGKDEGSNPYGSVKDRLLYLPLL